MKQILQNISNGETALVDVPCPKSSPGSLLIESRCSLVSVGTERMLVDFGKANYIDKARQQPDKVKMVLEKLKTDGIAPTVEAVRSKLDQPLPLGYCNVGRVIDDPESRYALGQRVVSNGHHAEVVKVAHNLTCAVPENVSDEKASFVVLAAIALQGIRLLKPTVGECIVVTGLGLIGLLAVQILRAQGCRVLGVDFDSDKCRLAREFGAEAVDLSKGEDLLSVANSFSRGRGVDAVLITASSKSNEPVSQAANACRKRGRIVLIGVVGLALSRADFYEKEISFQVSCSYGPGRYDPEYESKGNDYPVGYVRWTEQRNFEAILDLMSSGALDPTPLVSHRFPLVRAVEAYEELQNKAALGIVLEYLESASEKDLIAATVKLERKARVETGVSVPVCAFIGAGNYATRVLIPAFKASGVQLETIVSEGGVSAVHFGRKNGFSIACTDPRDVYENSEINTVAIVTRHNLHAMQVCEALRANKNVFVEKPLALNMNELGKIDELYRLQEGQSRLMVGFNRRFAPLVVKMKSLLDSIKEPKTFIITVNAGHIPSDHWVQDVEVGGGRIVGEGCHFIDLMRFLAGSNITSVQAQMMGIAPGIAVREDKASITLGFDDGSFGTIHYLSNGGKAFAKERIEVFCNDGVLQLDNFRRLLGFGWPGFRKMKQMRQDKGQNNCAHAFLESIRAGKESPIPYDEILEVTRISIEVADLLREQ